MITTIATVENDAIRDWVEAFKRSPLLRVAYTAQVATPGASATRLKLPHYNVIQNSIVVSDGTIVKGYRPYTDGGTEQISDVILASAPTVGATFSYTALKVSLRSPLNPYPELDPPLPSPRLIVLSGGTASMRARRQVNDDGHRVVRLKLFMTLLVDTDDGTGGPIERNNLVGTTKQVIEQSLDFLFELGYENVVIEGANLDVPAEEGTPTVYRGIILVSCEVNPLVWVPEP
jgi:hypothetical protein